MGIVELFFVCLLPQHQMTAGSWLDDIMCIWQRLGTERFDRLVPC